MSLKPGQYTVITWSEGNSKTNFVDTTEADLFINLDETKGNTSLTLVRMDAQKMNYMNSGYFVCDEDAESNSFDECLLQHLITHKTKCQLPWARLPIRRTTGKKHR